MSDNAEILGDLKVSKYAIVELGISTKIMGYKDSNSSMIIPRKGFRKKGHSQKPNKGTWPKCVAIW